jgi:hypothetical protein
MRIELALVGIAALTAACSDRRPEYVRQADACVEKIVPKGTKVPAQKARSAVEACRKPILEMANASMRNACYGPCDYTDERNVREFSGRKHAIEEHFLLQMSDEIQPTFLRM